ncbi:hypothetical protein BKA56DRAFT_617438 [Ilyonectria sp. MPI-CAGE-AT-0026]|nr:hypothetical protein BKA56DRAFT_617438 [Ilyonectria sp. MPI-CAGE-AT-0026]
MFSYTSKPLPFGSFSVDVYLVADSGLINGSYLRCLNKAIKPSHRGSTALLALVLRMLAKRDVLDEPIVFKNDPVAPRARFVSDIPSATKTNLLPPVLPRVWLASPNRTQYCSSHTPRKVHNKNKSYRYQLKLMGRLRDNRRLGRFLNPLGHSSDN